VTEVGLIVMLGRVTDGTGSTDPTIEQWSCSIATRFVDGTFTDRLSDIAGFCNTWFTDADSYISHTVTLDSVKFNGFDLATGHQTTDPTNEHTYSPFLRAPSSLNRYPLGTSYRISLDDGTRNRSHRGGFFVPRTTMQIDDSGRFDSTQIGNALATAATLLDAIDGLSNFSVGVWSRRNHAVTDVSRVRIGDVPDNISRRRNELREVYAEVAL